MAIHLAPISSADIPALARIQRLAFEPTFVHQSMFRSVPAASIDAFIAHDIQAHIDSETKFAIKATRADGRVMGMTLWTDKRAADDVTVEDKEDKKDIKWPEGADAEWANAFIEGLDLGVREAHLYLSILVVDPEIQHSGAGRALVEWGMRKQGTASANGKTLYLGAAPDALKFYLKLGFTHYGSSLHYHSSDPQGRVVSYPLSLPPITISPASAPDTPFLAQIHRQAFSPGVLFQTLFGKVKPEAFDLRMENRLKADLLETKKKSIWKAMRGAKIIALATWDLPQYTEEEAEKEVIKQRDFDEGANVEVAGPFFLKLEAHGRSIQGPHYHLQILSVHPDYQRQGVAIALMKWGMEKAEKEGLDLYLDATTAGYPVYKKYGFVEIGKKLLSPDGSFELIPMVLRATSPVSMKSS